MTIDATDIREFGGVLLKESLASMLRYPARSTVKYNDYAEVDGIEPDASAVRLSPRKIRLRILIRAATLSEFYTLYNRLIAVISAPGYRNIAHAGLVLNLRYDTAAECVYPRPFNAGANLTAFYLDFIEDIFSPGLATSPSGGAGYGQYRINNTDFGAFGIGSDSGIEDVLKYPGVKAPFTDGTDTWLSTVRVRHKEIKLSLWMTASSQGEFIRNHSAFFYALSRPGLQKLAVTGVGETNVYYKDCPSYSVVSFKGRFTAKFTVGFVIPVVTWLSAGGTSIMRVLLDNGTGKLLADSQGRVIIIN